MFFETVIYLLVLIGLIALSKTFWLVTLTIAFLATVFLICIVLRSGLCRKSGAFISPSKRKVPTKKSSLLRSLLAKLRGPL